VNSRCLVIFACTAEFSLFTTLPAVAQGAAPPPRVAGPEKAQDSASSQAVLTTPQDVAVRKREQTQGSGLPPPEPVLPSPERVRFIADPVSDGAVLSLALGTGALSEAILSTGEITPQLPEDRSVLLSIDRNAVDQKPIAAWGTVSNVGLLSAIGFAAADPVLSGFRDGSEAGIVDAFIYGETLAITWSITNLTKISFRRPRPSAYRDAQQLRDTGREAEIPDFFTDTNSALSFFSGHASITAAVSATATYLAFSRAPGTPRPWITLGAGGLLTALTCVGRVQSGEHFPTDVIAGAMAGIGIGILVPHVHRAEPATRRPVWIGAAPVPDGALVTASGLL
jgi:membrane-associated phospholipid phosphatase